MSAAYVADRTKTGRVIFQREDGDAFALSLLTRL